MKFPRNARIFRGQLDAAPFATVFFLLVLFVVLGRHLYPSGIRVDLPSAGNLDLPGTDQPTLPVAVTTNAIYYNDERVTDIEFSNKLTADRLKISQPVTLILEADKDVTQDRLIHIAVIASGAGIQSISWATRPRVFDPPDASAQLP